MIGLLIGALTFGILYLVFKSKTPLFSRYSDGDIEGVNVKPAVTLGIIILVSVLISIFQPLSLQRIDAGNIGMKIDRVGNDKGIPVARNVKGWVFYNSWGTDVMEYSIRQFHVQYDTSEVAAKGGTLIPVAPSFNVYLKPEKATEVYIHLLRGADLESLKDTWLKNAAGIALKNATNRFTPDSIFNHADIYQREVRKELVLQIGSYFNIDNQLNPGQSPPASMKGILQAKANAIQAAQQAELDRQTAVARAEQKIAESRGDSAKLVIGAKADAEAIRLKQTQITQQYIEYIKWSTWDGVMPSTVLGSGSNTLLNLK